MYGLAKRCYISNATNKLNPDTKALAGRSKTYQVCHKSASFICLAHHTQAFVSRLLCESGKYTVIYVSMSVH